MKYSRLSVFTQGGAVSSDCFRLLEITQLPVSWPVPSGVSSFQTATCVWLVAAAGSSDMSEGSLMSDESESDDDVSDNETLAARHNSLKRTASADDHVAKRRRSSSDSGSRSSHSRKRRNLFPVIRKSQRCGKCHTCLNPQLKKACLTVREQMMREARKGSHSTTSAAPRRAVNQQSSRSSPPAAATDVDKYSDLLVKFINASGGVSDIPSVQAFVTQLPRFDSSLARMLPCTVLGLSSRPVLAEFMARGGVDVLSNWMLQAMEDDNEPASQLLVEILGLLKKLPVTKAFVQSTKSAKVVGALRKHDNADVRKLARDVVALWMKAIPPSSSKATRYVLYTVVLTGPYRCSSGEPGTPLCVFLQHAYASSTVASALVPYVSS